MARFGNKNAALKGFKHMWIVIGKCESKCIKCGVRRMSRTLNGKSKKIYITNDGEVNNVFCSH